MTIKVGDWGTAIELTVQENGVAVDISGATTKTITFYKPDGTHVVKTAAFTTDGTDGKMRYTVTADELNQSGTWRAVGWIVTATGGWHTDELAFDVR